MLDTHRLLPRRSIVGVLFLAGLALLAWARLPSDASELPTREDAAVSATSVLEKRLHPSGAAASASDGAGPSAVFDGPDLDYQPSVVRDPDTGRLDMVFERIDPSTFSGDLYQTVSSDGGVTWDAPTTAVATRLNERHPALVRLPSGTLALFFLVEEVGAQAGFRIHRATSTGEGTWTSHGAIDLGWAEPGEVNPSVIVEDDGSLTMTYHRLSGPSYVARSTDGGATWDRRKTQVSPASAALPRVAKRESDGTYLVTFQTNPGDNNLDMWSLTTTDPYTWPEEPIAFSTDENSHDSQPLVLEDGTFVVFYAEQHGLGFDVFYRSSADGVEWSDASRVTDEETRYDTQPHPILGSAPDRVLLAWSHQDGDTPYGDHDVWVHADLPLDLGQPLDPPLPVLDQLGGQPGAFDAQGPFLYAGLGRQLAVFDASDAGRYEEMGRSDLLPSVPIHVAAGDGRVYVVTRRAPGLDLPNALVTLDVRDAARPTIVHVQYPFTYVDPAAIAVEGGLLYATGSFGVRVFDVQGTGPPTEVGSLDDGTDFSQLAVDGARVLVAYATWAEGAYHHGFKVIDASDATSPALMADHPLDDQVTFVALEGDVAVVGAGRHEGRFHLRAVDVTDPRQPIVSSRIEHGLDFVYAGVLEAGRLWLGGMRDDDPESYRVDGFDVSDPSAPGRLGGAHGLDEINRLAATQGRVYHGNDWSIGGVDVSDPVQPVMHGTTDRHIWFHHVVTDGQRLFALGMRGPWPRQTQRAVEYDVSDPDGARLVGPVATEGRIVDVHLEDGEAFAVETTPTGTCLWRSLDDPDGARVEVAGACADLDASGAIHAVATSEGVYVIARPPQDDAGVVGEVAPTYAPRYAAIGDGVAWVVSTDGESWWRLEAFDITRPSQPEVIGSASLHPGVPPNMNGPSQVMADGEIAWVGDDGRVRVFQAIAGRGGFVEHPEAAPAQGDPDVLARDGDALYSLGLEGTTQYTVVTYDLARPEAPRAIGAFDLWTLPADNANGMAAAGGRLYLSGYGSGITVLDAADAYLSMLPTPTPRAARPSATPTPESTPDATPDATPDVTPTHRPGFAIHVPHAVTSRTSPLTTQGAYR